MRYSRRTSNYQEIIVLSDLTHMMSMAPLIAIGERDIKYREWMLFGEKIHGIDPYKSLNGITPNYQSC